MNSVKIIKYQFLCVDFPPQCVCIRETTLCSRPLTTITASLLGLLLGLPATLDAAPPFCPPAALLSIRSWFWMRGSLEAMGPLLPSSLPRSGEEGASCMLTGAFSLSNVWLCHWPACRVRCQRVVLKCSPLAYLFTYLLHVCVFSKKILREMFI